MVHRDFREIRLQEFYPEAFSVVRQLRQPNWVTATQCHILFPIPTGFICKHRFENDEKHVFFEFLISFLFSLRLVEIGIRLAGDREQQRQLNGNRLWQKFLESISALPTPAWPSWKAESPWY